MKSLMTGCDVIEGKQNSKSTADGKRIIYKQPVETMGWKNWKSQTFYIIKIYSICLTEFKININAVGRLFLSISSPRIFHSALFFAILQIAKNFISLFISWKIAVWRLKNGSGD